MGWNLAHTAELSLEGSMPNLVKIGSDLAIAPIYTVHPICYICYPQPYYALCDNNIWGNVSNTAQKYICQILSRSVQIWI